MPFTETEFSAKLPQAQQNEQVKTMLAKGQKINFIRFEKTTVLPAGNDDSRGGEHMYSFDYAYLLEPARDWLLNQRKDN